MKNARYKRLNHPSIYGHTILTKNPHPNSLAGYVKYKKWLASMEIITVRERWMKFRHEFLSGFRRLRCFYCGKDNLQMYTQESGRLATVDHIVPISRGGQKYDRKNLCVACDRCNFKKGRELPLDYIRRLICQEAQRRKGSSLTNSLTGFMTTWKLWMTAFRISLIRAGLRLEL